VDNRLGKYPIKHHKNMLIETKPNIRELQNMIKNR
jgi:hypothetical protein